LSYLSKICWKISLILNFWSFLLNLWSFSYKFNTVNIFSNIVLLWMFSIDEVSIICPWSKYPPNSTRFVTSSGNLFWKSNKSMVILLRLTDWSGFRLWYLGPIFYFKNCFFHFFSFFFSSTSFYPLRFFSIFFLIFLWDLFFCSYKYTLFIIIRLIN